MRILLNHVIVGLVLAAASLSHAETKIEADSVWAEDIEQMYETDVSLPDWLRDTSGEAEPGTEIQIVKGLSGSAASSSAKSIAIREHILPRLKERANHPWSQRDYHIAEQWAENWLEKHTLSQFEQPFYKVIDGERYPAFTREAIQLDLSEDHLGELARHVNASVRKTHKLRKGIVWSASGLVGVILFVCVLIYIILDRITRGFYANRFRLMSTALFLISTGLVFYVARTMLSTI